MELPKQSTIRWLSLRVRILCVLALFVGSLLPPYVPRAALAQHEVTVSTQQFLLVEEGFLMKTSSLTQQGSRRAYAEGTYHTVKSGESLEKLANRWGISKDTIVWANNLGSSVSLQPGQELLILPVDGVLHTVSRGQTLLRIAELYGIAIEDIVHQNKIDGGFILAGQELIIPGGVPVISQSTQVAKKPGTPASKPTPSQPDQPSVPAIPSTPSFTPKPTAGVLQKPCSNTCFITQYYHGGHYALDMQERGGGPIFAAEAGTIIRADYGWNGGYGNVIEVDHGNELVTLYAHNKSLLVKEGDAVKRGQRIADMGATGLVYGQTGIHTHFEVRLRGIKKNPLLYIQ